jgi:hypothetical protein
VYSQNRLFVADNGNHRIVVLHAESGKFQHSFGGFGDKAGQLDSPTSLTVVESSVLIKPSPQFGHTSLLSKRSTDSDANSRRRVCKTRVWVCDYHNNRLQCFEQQHSNGSAHSAFNVNQFIAVKQPLSIVHQASRLFVIGSGHKIHIFSEIHAVELQVVSASPGRFVRPSTLSVSVPWLFVSDQSKVSMLSLDSLHTKHRVEMLEISAPGATIRLANQCLLICDQDAHRIHLLRCTGI